MTRDVGSFFQNVLLVSRLPWVIVVNDIGHSVFISPVGYDADMSFKNHNIAALPFLYFRDICGEGSCCVCKKCLQVPYPPEIYVCIRLCYPIILWVLSDICVHKHLQIISGIL